MKRGHQRFCCLGPLEASTEDFKVAEDTDSRTRIARGGLTCYNSSYFQLHIWQSGTALHVVATNLDLGPSFVECVELASCAADGVANSPS